MVWEGDASDDADVDVEVGGRFLDFFLKRESSSSLPSAVAVILALELEEHEPEGFALEKIGPKSSLSLSMSAASKRGFDFAGCPVALFDVFTCDCVLAPP